MLKRVMSIMISGLFIFAITLTLLEVTLAFLLDNPGLMVGGLLRSAREYYMLQDRKIIQFLPGCAVYDKDLFYILRPGTCNVANREYDVEYRINSAGIRDDESSLKSPEVVVTGDSQAMGWGVDQERIFPNLLEKHTGEKLLNAAVSSYGTVREMAFLERIDLDAMEYLVIQYSRNDLHENQSYRDSGNRIVIDSRAKYQKTVDRHMQNTSYYFLKHTRGFVLGLLNKLLPFQKSPSPAGKIPESTDETEARLFLNVLINSPVDMHNTDVIVIEINEYSKNDDHFIGQLNELAPVVLGAGVVKSLVAVDLSHILTPEKFFVLDGHINTDGHRAVADMLARLIEH